jgi:hypothetical protein
MHSTLMSYGVLVATCLQLAAAKYLAPLPEEYSGVSAVLIEDNLAVMPGNWSYESNSMLDKKISQTTNSNREQWCPSTT